jgi:hypothetical protein
VYEPTAIAKAISCFLAVIEARLKEAKVKLATNPEAFEIDPPHIFPLPLRWIHE